MRNADGAGLSVGWQEYYHIADFDKILTTFPIISMSFFVTRIWSALNPH